MRLNLLLLLLLFATMASAQITFPTGPFVVNVNTAVADKKIDFDISNENAKDAEFWWELDRGSCPAEWEFYLCDMNLCYTPLVQSCPCSKPNVLEANTENVLMLHILPNGVEGMGVINLRLLSECEGTTTMVDVPVQFRVDNTTSTEFGELNYDISIYPNPTLDVISLKDDQDVSEIVFYNIIGKKIKSVDHLKGQTHEVTDLDKGIYLVRLLNNNGNVLKVLRLTKK